MPHWSPPDRAAREALLRGASSVAVIGASANPHRPAFEVTQYLLSSTPYLVHLVNPTTPEIMGRRVAGSLVEIGVPIDIVDVFRRRSAMSAVAEEAIAAGAHALWFQQGLYDEDVAQRATDAGLTVVMDRCLKVDHASMRLT